MDNTMAKGSKVVVSEGPLQGLLAVVTEVMPSSKRVEVLLDFLGQQTSARLSQEKVLKLENPRKEIEVG